MATSRNSARVRAMNTSSDTAMRSTSTLSPPCSSRWNLVAMPRMSCHSSWRFASLELFENRTVTGTRWPPKCSATQYRRATSEATKCPITPSPCVCAQRVPGWWSITSLRNAASSSRAAIWCASRPVMPYTSMCGANSSHRADDELTGCASGLSQSASARCGRTDGHDDIRLHRHRQFDQAVERPVVDGPGAQDARRDPPRRSRRRGRIHLLHDRRRLRSRVRACRCRDPRRSPGTTPSRRDRMAERRRHRGSDRNAPRPCRGARRQLLRATGEPECACDGDRAGSPDRRHGDGARGGRDLAPRRHHTRAPRPGRVEGHHGTDRGVLGCQ